jgi:hypothetical protein
MEKLCLLFVQVVVEDSVESWDQKFGEKVSHHVVDETLG